MSFNEVVIDVQGLGKRYEIYATPRDRLKQLVLPSLRGLINRSAQKLGLSNPKEPPVYYREFWALRNISFQVKRGETIGVIGRNGGGKSTLLQILAGTLTPTCGEAKVNGRIAALLELGSGFNPEFTGRENVFLNGRILGLSKKELEARYEQIVEFADIGDFIDQPVKTYSSGMFVRLAFAVQANIDASVVIIDEALAVGDVFFRQKCYARLAQLKASGAAILLVSHSMPDIEQYCDRAIVLDRGAQYFTGSSSEAAKHYYLLHQGHDKKVAVDVVPAPAISASCGEAISRPPLEAFIDISSKSQVSNGQARCVAIALCNEAGQPCNHFRQGDIAIFYHEYELLDDIDVPIGGLVITNERGLIVFGKNAWQYDGDLPLNVRKGCRVVCRQEVSLQLQPGEYTFETGFASMTSSEWENRALISHEEWSSRYKTLCVVTSAGQLSIGYAFRNGISVLTHHGIADLPGKMSTGVVG